MAGKHRRQPPRHDGTGRHRAAPGGLARTLRRAAAIAVTFAVAAGTWVSINNELALRNGTTPVVQFPQPTAPPAAELPEPMSLGPAPAAVPVIPDSAPDTGGERPDFNRDCLIINLGQDVKPPVRDITCFLKDEFPEIGLTLGVGPRAHDGSGHEDGLSVDLFIEDEDSLEQVKTCAARHFRGWNLRNIIHGDLIMVESGGEFRPMSDHEDPGGPAHIHLALNDESPVRADTLTC